MRGLLLAIALLWAAAPAAALPVSAELPRGQVVEVTCAAQPSQSYALYLPAGYTPQRKWPIVYAFDPRGNGAEVVSLLRPGAERFGWIVAGSHNASNLTPPAKNMEAMSALWADTHMRFPVDDRRVHALGSSGLVGFVVSLAVSAPGSLAGVIGVNGGWPSAQPPAPQSWVPFFLTTGEADLSYYELRGLEGKLAVLGLPHRLEIFPGSSPWPPEEVFTRALGWMELQAIKRGIRERDPAFVEELWSEELSRARALEAAGRLDAAHTLYSALVRDFYGLLGGGPRGIEDIREADRGSAALATSEAFRRQREARLARDRRDREYLAQVPRLFQSLPPQAGPERTGDILAALRIPELKQRAKSDPDPEERIAAERLLGAVYVQTGIVLPREYVSQGQYDRAILFLQVASEVDPEVAFIPYRIAATYARMGDRRRALDYLEISARKGWDDLEALEHERAFDPLRKTDEYQRIVSQIRRRVPPR